MRLSVGLHSPSCHCSAALLSCSTGAVQGCFWLCRLTDGCCKLLSCLQVVSNWVLMTKRAMFVCPVFSSLLSRCRVKVKPCSELIQNFIEPICVKLYILVALSFCLILWFSALIEYTCSSAVLCLYTAENLQIDY